MSGGDLGLFDVVFGGVFPPPTGFGQVVNWRKQWWLAIDVRRIC